MADNVFKGVIVIQPGNSQQVFSNVAKSAATAQTSLTKLTTSSNQSTLALTNLGRVVQDAPFGFLGIANNLNPLLESFQRLKATTGTTGGALKALGGSLLGAGGLGFAISLLSTGLILFGDRLFGVGKKAKEAEDAMKDLGKSVAEPAAKLTTLVGIIKNVNSTYDDKVKALKAINAEYGKYLDSLGKEEISLKNIDEAYGKIIDQLLRQAVVKGLQDEIEKQVAETAKGIVAASIAIEKEKKSTEANTKAKLDTLTAEQRFQQRLAQSTGVIKDGAIASADYNSEIRDSIIATNGYEAVIARLKAQLFETLKPLLNLTSNFEDLGITLSKTKDIEAFVPLVTIKPDRTKVDLSQSKIQLPALSVTPDQGLADDILPLSAVEQRLSQVLELFSVKIGAAQKKLKDKLSGGFITADDIIKKQELDRFNETITSIANEGGNNFAIAFAEGLGNLAVGGGIQDIFSSIFSAIGSVLQQLGAAMIVASKLFAQIKASFATLNPVLAAVAGIGLVALGTVIRGITGKVSARAEGGPVTGGSPYLVGERGPELFVPNTGGRIIPNNALGASGGGLANFGGGGEVYFRVRGNDLVAVLAAANRFQRRNV